MTEPKKDDKAKAAPKGDTAQTRRAVPKVDETDEQRIKREQNELHGRTDTIDVGDGVKREVSASGRIEPPLPDDYDPLPAEPEPMQPAGDQ